MGPSSQTLPDHLGDPSSRAPSRSASRLGDQADDGWDRTLRPAALDSAASRSIAHSRESSLEKLPLPPSQTHSAASSIASPRLHSSHPRGGIVIGGVLERLVDPKNVSYGHHRQTSIVHGIQHSRNGSIASSTSSPLSPEIIAAAGAGFIPDMPPVPRIDSEAQSFTSLSGATLASNPQNPQINPGYQRKVERMHSRSRRDQSQHRSHSSRHHRDDRETIGEYSLHVLLTSFIAQVEEKMGQCIPYEFDQCTDHICGYGVDPAFDQSIVALGHIARRHPRPLIDSMMVWRRKKSELANEARSEANQRMHQSKNSASVGLLQRRNTEPPLQQGQPANGPPSHVPGIHANLASKDFYVVQAERMAAVAIYVLCRVLLEVLSQSTLVAIGPDLEDRLEGVIVTQLGNGNLEQLILSPLKMANWNIFVCVLGAMSEINFSGVTQKLLSEIDSLLNDMGPKGLNPIGSREKEGRTELVLAGMRSLRLKTAPEGTWGQSCEFLLALGRMFQRARGQRIKGAFCGALEALLLPIAAKAGNAEFLSPKWSDVLSSFGPRLSNMLAKPRHWAVAFPLTATSLCVSPAEVIASQWLQLVLALQPKLKDPKTQSICLQAISRLVWAYLFRTGETYQSVVRKLEDVWKLILPVFKRPFFASDSAVAEPIIQIVRLIGFKYPEYCFKSIISPSLINAELFRSNIDDIKYDQLDPDRIVIGIRASLAILGDLERDDDGRPLFPQTYAAASQNTERAERGVPHSPAGSPSTQSTSTAMTYQDEDLARPLAVSTLSENVREHYLHFCEVLGKVTIICDNTFGGQAALDEKFNPPPLPVPAAPVPKTPISDTFNFSRREERRDEQQQQLQAQKQAFYELLHVCMQALPRCLPTDISFNSLINLLCTGTAHVQTRIAHSATQSLKSIARQTHAQQVTMGFARFIFNFDATYSTMSDGGMLGPGHIENTLRLYLDLLRIWIDEIRQKAKDAQTEDVSSPLAERRALQLDLSGIWAEVDQAEAHGLFFLCSQSRRVRRFAITVLRLIIQFDQALGEKSEKDTPRLIDILENDSKQVMEFKDENLSVAERSRLQRGMQNSNNQAALVELCTSDVSYDTTLWYKIFPKFINLAHERCPFTVTICRDLVSNRIVQLYPAILAIGDPNRGARYGAETGSARLTGRPTTTQPEVLVEQWRLYLIFACTTLGDPGPTAPIPPGQNNTQQHSRKGSKNTNMMEGKKLNVRTLIKILTPLFRVPSTSVRDATVSAMGSINIHLYSTLLSELRSPIDQVNNESRTRAHQRTNSNPKRNRTLDQMRTELAHVYKLTAHFLQEMEVYQNDEILRNLTSFTTDLKLFLMDGEVQMDWEFQKLRRHYCGIMEQLFEGINKSDNPALWMNFESRKSAFSLMEEWCGFSPNQTEIRVRESTMRQSLMDQQSSLGERGTVTAAMEIEKRNLRTAALSAMAALCAGPLGVVTDGGVRLQFDIRRLLTWVETIFNSNSNQVNLIGRRALQNLIVHNRDHPYLLEHCMSRCYVSDVPKVLESYFMVATQVVLDNPIYPCPFWKMLGLSLYTLGNDRSEMRSRAAHILKVLEERQQRNSKLQDFDISISDRTQAVYKLAQFEISKRFAKGYTELAFYLFSQFTLFFKELSPSHQRNVVAVILPWIQAIELKVDPNGGPTACSYVLLANLLEFTIKSSGSLHNEVQALWQALATGPHPGNVRLILDFIISLCLDRREQNFVEYAKQVVVFLSSTNAAPSMKVVEFLLMQINPKAMAPNEKRDTLPPPPDINLLPYCADLAEALPMGTKQAGFSLGQLSMILLVDLMVSPVGISQDHLPILLQVVTVLWDHYTPLVQEQAREMLVHLIHELVISRLDDETHVESKRLIEDMIDSIRRHDRLVVWGYEDGNGKGDSHDNKVPPSMEHLTAVVVKTFETTFPGIKEQWGKLSLTWATSCPVRHLACRSFQIFRCILTSLDHLMLGDMLARLSNTIADEDTEIQTFAMEILATLRTLIVELEVDCLLNLPQLFWAICACLDSINEREFLEAVGMLDEFLSKVDLQPLHIRQVLLDGQPPRWDGPFEGMQPLLYKGLRSSLCWDATLSALDKVARLSSDPLVGDDNRVFFAVLANFPRLLQELETSSGIDEGILETAGALARVCQLQGLTSIAMVLDDYISYKYPDSLEFLGQLFSALREHFLPQLDFKMVTFCMGLLTNSLPWVRIQTMRILKVALPEVDMRNPDIGGHGSDLISPLLRLLPTEYCMEAIDVLGSIRVMPASSMDSHHLRMSMTRPTSRAIRKEYERTQSLFGIPEESGWAIPIPAKKTNSTRANIHAAFYTCQSAEGTTAIPDTTTEVEFHADDFPYGYFQPLDRAETMMSDGAHSNVGDLVTKLDSLDDFFDGPGDSHFGDDDGHSSRTVTEYAPETYESGAQLYDEQILPILHQASNSSFQNGFTDRPPVPIHENGVYSSAVVSPRPGLQGRSVTMPMNPGGSFTSLVGDMTSDEDYSEDRFSDLDDDRPNNGGGSEGFFYHENTVRPHALNARSNHPRRLAAARLREGDRMGKEIRLPIISLRNQSQNLPAVPSVPAVPDIYTKSIVGQGDMV